MTKRIAIIGSGIVGRTIALTLHCPDREEKKTFDDSSVTIFEKSPDGKPQSASYFAGGLITPESEVDLLPSEILKIASLALGKHAEFRRIHGLDGLCEEKGSLVIAHTRDQTLWNDQLARLARISEDVEFKVLNRDELGNLEPTLERFPQALFFPRECHLDCRDWLGALDERMASAGIDVRYDHDMTPSAPSLSKDFDLVIDCRGMGAVNDIADLRGVLGESIIVETDEVKLSRPVRVLHPRYPLYIVPRSDNKFYVGATALESEREKGISVRSALELLSALISVQPMFGEAHLVETIRAQRPTFFGHAPKILYGNRLLRVNGMFRYGFFLAPFLASLVRDFLRHEQVPEYGAAFFARG
ncbi:MAG: FAD-dependent oxidoreductase [Oligoflexales bacterium]